MTDTSAVKLCVNCTRLLVPPKEANKPRTPRVTELFNQNQPPLDREVTDLRRVLQDTPIVLQDLDQKIAWAQETLDNLLSARNQAQSHFEDAKAILHPLRRVPNEVLSEVFQNCVPSADGPLDSFFDSLHPRMAPWVLTHVSRRWRQLALQSPRLWAYLLLDFDELRDNGVTRRQCAYKTGLFIERSRNLPMTVYLGGGECVIDHPVLSVLEVSIPRWERLWADLPRTSLQYFSGNPFLSLRVLEIYHQPEIEPTNLDLFGSNAPALRVLQSTPRWRALEQVELPWTQFLTVNKYPAFDVHGFEYLRRMTNLKDLEVVISSDYAPIETTLTLTNLHRLSIVEDGQSAPGRGREFFSSLTTPNLRELELRFPVGKRVAHFPTFGAGAADKLVKLDITGAMGWHADNTTNLLDFLSLTHCVEQLRMDDVCMTADFFIGLTVFEKSSHSGPTRLPFLRVLDVVECTCHASLRADIAPIFDMLESRMIDLEEAETAAIHVSQSSVDPDTPSDTSNHIRANVSLHSPASTSCHRRSRLRTIRVPRWLYTKKFQRWRAICAILEVECGANVDDEDDEDDDDDE